MSGDTLQQIRGLALANRVRFSAHSRLRMSQRGMSVRDVMHALTHARSARPAEQSRFKAVGPDLDGDDITAIVELDNGVLVVTVY